MPRMRTIDGLMKEIKEMDSSSNVSRNFIRQLVLTGKVKSIRAGNKYLVNLDELLEYLANPTETTTPVIEFGKLRKING